jgi:hypothetical protein
MFLVTYIREVQTVCPRGTSATEWPIERAPGDYDDWQGKQKYSEKTCPSATLSTTNPT